MSTIPRTCMVCGKTGLKYPDEVTDEEFRFVMNLSSIARECPRCGRQFAFSAYKSCRSTRMAVRLYALRATNMVSLNSLDIRLHQGKVPN